MHTKFTSRKSLSRRLLLIGGSILLIYPFIRFILHRVPRKPVTVKITEPLKQDRYLASNEFYIFAENEKIWAVSRKCTHLGCRLNYKEEENILECPCHQSRFSSTGQVMNGPSQRQLPTYKVERNSDPPFFIVSI